MLTSLAQAGSAMTPNCIAGQQPKMLPDGSWVCSTNITAASLGVPPPDCGAKAQAQLDASGQWTCMALTTSGMNPLVMLLIAGAAWFYFSRKRKASL
jgi:hypothetical protein